MGVSAQTGIKSIQRGIVTIANAASSGTATITAVNTSKAQIRHLGNKPNAATSATISEHGSIVLTNSTTITAERGGTSQPLAIPYEVTEWY